MDGGGTYMGTFSYPSESTQIFIQEMLYFYVLSSKAQCITQRSNIQYRISPPMDSKTEGNITRVTTDDIKGQ